MAVRPSSPPPSSRVPTALRAASDAVRTWASDVGRLVVPVVCAGCGEPDVPWCEPCRAALLPGPPFRVEVDAPRLDRLDGVAPLPVWACTGYAGPVREMVPAWKDQGRLDLTPLMSDALRAAGAGLAAVLPARTLVVPVPTTVAARRRRGEDLVGLLAGAFAQGAVGAGAGAEVRRLLGRPRSRDQVGLGVRARGRVVVRVRGQVPRGASVVLVDDVLTTGGTLAACENALAARGVVVLAAVVLAATPRAGGAGRPDRGGSGADTPGEDLRPLSPSPERV